MMFRAAGTSLQRSVTRPCCFPVPWWTDKCRDAIYARKLAFRYFQVYPTYENITQFKCLCAKAWCAVHKAEHTSWKMYMSSLFQSTPSAVIWNKICQISGKYEHISVPSVCGWCHYYLTNKCHYCPFIGQQI